MSTTSVQDSSLFQRLQRETTAEVRFDEFSRGLYSTDASIYQIKPLGVVVPKPSRMYWQPSASPMTQAFR